MANKIMVGGLGVRVGQKALLLTVEGDWANIKCVARGLSRFKDSADAGFLLPELELYPISGSWLPYAELPGAA